MPAPTDPRLVVADRALDRAGADGGPDASVVVREGLSLLVRRHDVVVRIRDRTQEPTAVREVAVARALAAVGVAHTALVDPDAQPWAIEGSVVTAWRWTDPVRTAEPADLGSLVATMRARTRRVAEAVPRFDPLAAAVEAISHIPPGDDQGDFVRRRARELAPSWAAVTDDDPAGTSIVHGDLHRDNVVVGVDGPLLTDLELAGSGPPSYDVAHAARAVERFAADLAGLESFIAVAGWDPRSWQGFATCVAVSELWGTAWAVGVRDRAPQLAAEATLRVECLRDGATHTWHLL